MTVLIVNRPAFVNLIINIVLFPIIFNAFYQPAALCLINPKAREEATYSFNAVLKAKFKCGERDKINSKRSPHLFSR